MTQPGFITKKQKLKPKLMNRAYTSHENKSSKKEDPLQNFLQNASLPGPENESSTQL